MLWVQRHEAALSLSAQSLAGGTYAAEGAMTSAAVSDLEDTVRLLLDELQQTRRFEAERADLEAVHTRVQLLRQRLRRGY